MSETTPPVPKSGGNGPFILAAIVMLLLMGGLIYWKTKGSGTDTAKVEAPKPSAAVEQPGLDEPPPPPPPIASTDASATPDTTKPTKKLGGVGGGACGPCTGDATPSIVSALHAKGAQARSCYEHALRQNAMLAGRMSINITISATGSVCSAGIGSNGLGDPSVANCVVQMMKSGTFSPPGGGSCVQVAVPLNFTPKT
jgi:hypothetical protein